MKVTISLVVFVHLVALAQIGVRGFVTLRCHTSFIAIFTNDFNDHYVRLLDDDCTPVLLTGHGTQRATLYNATCPTPEVGVNFTIGFMLTINPVTSMEVRDAVCEFQDGAGIILSRQVSLPDSDGSLAGLFPAGVTLRPSSNAMLIGDSFTLTISLPAASIGVFTMQLESFAVSTNIESVSLVEDGCIVQSKAVNESLFDVIPSPTDDEPTRFSIEFNAFVPGNGSLIDSVTVVRMTARIKFCNPDSDAVCYNATGCDGAPQFGRRRRDVKPDDIEDEAIQTLTSELVIFTQEESQDTFINDMREMFGITDATQLASKDDLCINKKSSAALLVCFAVGMLICLLATCWMFFKLRKSRKLQKEDKSKFSYSNKSY